MINTYKTIVLAPDENRQLGRHKFRRKYIIKVSRNEGVRSKTAFT
jgi:hypothetical protein